MPQKQIPSLSLQYVFSRRRIYDWKQWGYRMKSAVGERLSIGNTAPMPPNQIAGVIRTAMGDGINHWLQSLNPQAMRAKPNYSGNSTHNYLLSVAMFCNEVIRLNCGVSSLCFK